MSKADTDLLFWGQLTDDVPSSWKLFGLFRGIDDTLVYFLRVIYIFYTRSLETISVDMFLILLAYLCFCKGIPLKPLSLRRLSVLKISLG